MREEKTPYWFKTLTVLFLSSIWKFYYYAPNTLKELEARKAQDSISKGTNYKVKDFEVGAAPATIASVARAGLYRGNWAPFVECVSKMMPYAAMTFGIIPGVAALAFGPTAGTLVLMNMILAEFLTNIHSFMIIVTNHVGYAVSCAFDILRCC